MSPDEDGRLLPESFVDYEAVERFFRSPRAFIAFLYVRKEDEAAIKQEIYVTTWHPVPSRNSGRQVTDTVSITAEGHCPMPRSTSA